MGGALFVEARVGAPGLAPPLPLPIPWWPPFPGSLRGAAGSGPKMGLRGGAASREGAECGPCAWYLGLRRAHAYLQRATVRVQVAGRVKVVAMPRSRWGEGQARGRGRGRARHQAPGSCGQPGHGWACQCPGRTGRCPAGPRPGRFLVLLVAALKEAELCRGLRADRAVQGCLGHLGPHLLGGPPRHRQGDDPPTWKCAEALQALDNQKPVFSCIHLTFYGPCRSRSRAWPHAKTLF